MRLNGNKFVLKSITQYRGIDIYSTQYLRFIADNKKLNQRVLATFKLSREDENQEEEGIYDLSDPVNEGQIYILDLKDEYNNDELGSSLNSIYLYQEKDSLVSQPDYTIERGKAYFDHIINGHVYNIDIIDEGIRFDCFYRGGTFYES